MLYLISLAVSFITGFLLIILLIKISHYFDPHNRNNWRHIHQKGISRLGGLALILAFIVGVVTNPYLVMENQHWAIVLASLIILIVGLIDDFWKLDWKIQLFFQVAVAILIFILGIQIEYITNPLGGVIFLKDSHWLLPSLFLGIIWVIIIMNAMNWLDGLDGLSGGVTLIGGIIIFILSLKPEVNQPPLAIMAISLIGAVLAFLIFNFYPAKIMAGTSGSMFMGFILAALAIFAGAKIATTLLVLIIPLIDAFWVITERWRKGCSIVSPDHRHLHYKLLEIGYAPQQIALFYYGTTGLMGFLALRMSGLDKLKLLLVAVLLVIVIVLITQQISGKYKLLK